MRSRPGSALLLCLPLVGCGDACEVRVTQAMMHDSRPELIDLLVKPT